MKEASVPFFFFGRYSVKGLEGGGQSLSISLRLIPLYLKADFLLMEEIVLLYKPYKENKT